MHRVELHRARCAGKGAELLCSLQFVILPAPARVRQRGTSQDPRTFGVFVEASSRRQEVSPSPLTALLPHLEDGAGRRSSKLPSMPWCLYWPGPAQEPTKDGLYRTEDAPVTQRRTRDLGIGTRNRGQMANVRAKMVLLILLSLRTFPGFGELCARNWEHRPTHTVSIISQGCVSW